MASKETKLVGKQRPSVGGPKSMEDDEMKTNVGIKSSRVKSDRGRARRENATDISRDMVKALEAACVSWLERNSQHSQHDGTAVQALDQLIERTEQENRARREMAEKESQYPHPENLADFRCQDCDVRFLADRVFDVARKVEVALLAAGHRAELTPTDEMLAESFEAPRKWMRCPECASSNICHIQEQNEVEAGSMETVIDVAGEILRIGFPQNPLIYGRYWTGRDRHPARSENPKSDALSN